MTVINPKRIANDPRLGWRDKVQAITFALFLSLQGDRDAGEEVPDFLYDWVIGRTAFPNITAWSLPG